MKRTQVGRLLGLTLAVIMGVSTPVSAFAQEEVGGLLAVTEETEEAVETAEAEETEEASEEADAEKSEVIKVTEEAAEEETEVEAEAADEKAVADTVDAEAAVDAAETGTLPEAEETEDAALVSAPEVNLTAEFIDFGDEADAFIKEQGQDAYEIKTNRMSDKRYFLTVVLKMWPFITNTVLDSVAVNYDGNDSEDKLGVRDAYYCSSYAGTKNCFVIELEMGADTDTVPVEFLESGAKLSFKADWSMNVLRGYTLNANGGVFDDTVLFGGSSITYTAGDSKSLKPVEGNDNNTTVTVTYNQNKTVAYVPVMQNGFLPLPQDNAGVSMDLAGRPYDKDRLPLLGWNTKSDGSGEFYTGEQILLDKTFRYNKTGSLDTLVNLYAIFPEYYGAEFILDGESYVGDYWTNTPNPGHKDSLQNLFLLATKGAEDKLVKEGYTLSWFLNEDCTIPADFATKIDDCKKIRDRLTVYGQWTKNVPEVKTFYGTVFFKNVDGAEEGVKLEVGNTLDLSKYLFTRKGYTFKNWTATVGGKTKTFAKNAKIAKCFKNDGEELTLTANWSINTYKINYVLNGGTQAKTAPKTYNVEAGVSLPTPAKTGYVFKGWDVKKDGKAVTDSAELALVYDEEKNVIPAGNCGNLTLSAKFVPFGYKILFHVEGAAEPMVLVDYGYYEPLKYTDTISFNDAAMQIEDTLGWHETKPGENNPNRDRKIIGFSKTEGGKVDFDRIKKYTKLSQDVEELHLYAVLEEKTYYINYHLDEYERATLSKPLYTFKSGNKRFNLPTAKCPGFKFYGWEFNQSRNSDKSLFYSYIRRCTPYACDVELATTVAANVNNDIEVWPYFVPNKIKVYVSPNGSGVYEDVQVETYEGTDIRRKKVTSKRAFGEVYYGSDHLASEWYNESMNDWYRPGYEFVGYSKNPKATSADEIFTKLYYGIENFSSVATSGSGTIYCIWKKNVNTIDNSYATIIDDGEIVDEHFWGYKAEGFPFTMTYGEGKSVTLPKASLEGYEFLGWKSDHLDKFSKVTKKNGYITAIAPTNCYDLEVYPVFRRCVYDLVINCNGGSYDKLKTFYIARGLDYSDDVAPYLTGFTHLNVTRKGYKLMGFSKDPKGATGIIIGADGKPVYKSHTLSLNGNKKVTLYAIWKKN
ncbi:MAG: hypothetical protein E7307_11470 [Butyrivibrio sp.]|nr:hypothetical protein [Butyrivibrio sp.]